MSQVGHTLGEVLSSRLAEALVLWPAAGWGVLQSTRGRDPESIPEASTEMKITLGAFSIFFEASPKHPQIVLWPALTV